MTTDSLARGERAVLELWDEGVPMHRIARRLDMSRKRVGSIVTSLTGDDDHRRHRKAMVDSNTAFLAALQSTPSKPRHP